MSIKVERTKVHKTMDDSAEAYVDLSGLHQCMIRAIGAATGNLMATVPTGQGALVYGALLNAPVEGAMAELQVEGIAEVRADSTFDAGVELTVAGVNGRVEAAASGDYVCGISREAAIAVDHCISMTIKHYYKA